MTQTTPEQAMNELTKQAQELDMGYGKDPSGLTPQTTKGHIYNPASGEIIGEATMTVDWPESKTTASMIDFCRKEAEFQKCLGKERHAPQDQEYHFEKAKMLLKIAVTLEDI